VTQKEPGQTLDGKVDSGVRDLEKMLHQAEASEKQAWRRLEELDSANLERAGDLRQYIASMEHNKRLTTDAVAQLLQIECDLRQQLNRKRTTASATSAVNQDDDATIDDVSKSLRNIVQRLQMQQESSFRITDRTAAEPSGGHLSSVLHGNQNGGVAGVESDEGYDGNSNSFQSDSFRGYRDAEPTTARITVLEQEVVRLTRLLDAYRWSHGENRLPAGGRGPIGDVTPSACHDTNLLQAQNDVRRLQSRVNDLETEKLELERELNKTTSRLREEVERLQSGLQLQKNESHSRMSELRDVETGLRRTTKELREQVELEKEKRQCLEKELLDSAEGKERFQQQLQAKERSLADLREKMDLAEQTNKQLLAQVNFLTQSNESLMEDIDDNNERMSDELANCRQGRSAAESRCAELESHCEKLTETVGLLAERARALEKSLEETERKELECERLRHEHEVLVASEEKLVDKINDKDETARRLMEELAECKTALEEQSHKLQMTNVALEGHKNDGSRCLREAGGTKSREKYSRN